MTDVALYCRLSPRPDGSYEGVESQEQWGREYAARMWPGIPVQVFADAGISAANGDYRPGFEALRAAIDRGDVAYLWAVEQYRLIRTEVGWFAFAAQLDAAGIKVVHTNRDGIVRIGDEVAGIKAVLGAAEVRRIKQRTNDRLAALAAGGRPSGATTFGYRRGLDDKGGKTLFIVPEEADIIRDAAHRILAGWGLERIAADLRARGLHGPLRTKVRDENGNPVLDDRGNPITRPSRITAQSVRSMITNPVVAGFRVYNGRFFKGVWEAILSEDTWHAVRDKLAAPRAVQCINGGTYSPSKALKTRAPRRYLLTAGISQCGECNYRLVAGNKKFRNEARPYYVCHPKTGGRACVAMAADLFENYVIEKMFEKLDNPEFLAAFDTDSHAQERERITEAIRRVESRRRALATAWGSDEMTDEEWQAARQALGAREQDLRAQLAAIPPPTRGVNFAAVKESWPELNLDERQEIVRMLIARVDVRKATPGGRFRPERITIVWRR